MIRSTRRSALDDGLTPEQRRLYNAPKQVRSPQATRSHNNIVYHGYLVRWHTGHHEPFQFVWTHAPRLPLLGRPMGYIQPPAVRLQSLRGTVMRNSDISP